MLVTARRDRSQARPDLLILSASLSLQYCHEIVFKVPLVDTIVTYSNLLKMNKKLCILLVLTVLCSATFAGKSKESSKEKSKEKSKENSGSKESASNESSSKEVTSTESPATTTASSSDRCAGQPDGTILPSLTTCANFVTCQGEVEASEATCVPSGTIFDSSRGVCDYEPNVVCTVEGETSTTVTEPSTEVPTTGPEPTQNELKGMCKGVIIDMIAHPGNCNKFIICVLGKPNIQSCGKNEVFYSDIKLCAFGNPKKC